MKTIVKNVLRRPYHLLCNLHSRFLSVFRCGRWPASLCYAFFSGAFGREHRAVLAGKHIHQKERDRQQGNSATLRRNIHRLEKGLSMPNRRQVFALDFITETVAQYQRLVAPGAADKEELWWSRDVLVNYFAVVDDVPVVSAARKRFESFAPLAHATVSTAPKVPRPRGTPGPSPVDYDHFLQLCHRRESVRWFTDQTVDRALIDQALQAGIQAPSACNRQPFRFEFFDDPVAVRDVITIPGGTTGFRDQVPVVAVAIGQLRAYSDERDRHIVYIDSSLAIMGFLLALESLGLSSCTINLPDVERQERALAKRLQLAPDERPIMLIAIGYAQPKGMVPHSAKKPVATLRRWNAHS